MGIDWQALTDNITSSIKNGGAEWGTGAAREKIAQSEEDNAGPTLSDIPAPPPIVCSRPGPAENSNGADFIESDQPDSGCGPIRASGPSELQQGGAPFADCVQKLRATPAPEAFWGDRWQRIIDDSAAFVATWGEQAHKLGWTEIDLFGVHPTRPACRFDLMGLIPLTDGGEIIAMTATTATTRKPSGSIQRYTRREQRGAVLLWEVK